MTQQHEEKNVRNLAESVLFYVGIPAALLYDRLRRSANSASKPSEKV